jgi:hypothetical protein
MKREKRLKATANQSGMQDNVFTANGTAFKKR